MNCNKCNKEMIIKVRAGIRKEGGTIEKRKLYVCECGEEVVKTETHTCPVSFFIANHG